MKLSLRTRFTAAFALAALVPIAAAAVISREIIQRRYRAEYATSLRSAKADAEREVKRTYDEMQAIASGFATARWPVEIALELRKGEGRLSEAKQSEFRDDAPGEMRSLGLDVMSVLAPDGRVLASGHSPGQVGSADHAALAMATKDRASLRKERVLDQGQTPSRLVVEAAARISRSGLNIVPAIVVVGRVVDSRLLEHLHRHGQVEVRLVGDGIELTPAGEPWAESAEFPFAEVPLPDVSGKPGARLIVSVPDTELQSTLRQLTIGAAALAAGGLLLSVLLGMLVTRRITRDLGLLVEGAQAVARGDLEHRVVVKGGGEIGELAGTFNRMTTDLGEANVRLVQAERIAAWQEIARRIAHEIKNPLTPIQMSMETLRRTYKAKHPKLDEIFEESTKTVLEECGRLKRIVNEFSQFARMPKPELVACDLAELVTAALALYAGTPVVRDLGEGLPPVRADRDQLTQVVLNLLENARDAVKDKADAKITIRARREGAGVLLEVADNGVGITPEVRDKIFTPYFTTKQAGTGLGLAIVHRIVTDHGGRITVEAEPGKGATFRVVLPIA